jgi:hypothetical protein
MKKDSKKILKWGLLGAVFAWVFSFILINVNEMVWSSLVHLFLNAGFNPREEVLTCLLIMTLLVSTLGYLAGWSLFLLCKTIRRTHNMKR